MNLVHFIWLQKNNYALAAFNICNIEQLHAIFNAANTLNSPLIIAVSSGALKYMHPKILIATIKAFEEIYTNIFFAFT